MRAEDPLRWDERMRQGDFSGAWDICDRVMRDRRRESCARLPRHVQWIWNGSPIEGRHVLVRCYHGLGDTIQFARYLPMLRARARTVTLWTQPSLIPILSTMRAADRLLPLHDGEPGVAYDVDVEIMELPYLFRTTLDTIPARVPYLHVDPLELPRDHRPTVGIVWKAGDWAGHRSIPLSQLAPLMTVPVLWYALQGGPALDERPPHVSAFAGATGIMEAARAMHALDLLITVDSMPAHLGGALGVPVWTLLPHEADWRWMNGRDDSPWYPTMRLFRQGSPAEWTELIRRVAMEVEIVAGIRCDQQQRSKAGQTAGSEGR